MDTFPSHWLDQLSGMPRVLTLDVAGYPGSVNINRDDLARVYLPVLHVMQTALVESQRRIVAGLGGIPGSGKSTFAAVLARIADIIWGTGRLAVVGMDGWHWPNAVLDVRTTTDESGNAVPLRQRKGGPDSYDIAGIAAAVNELRAADHPVSLPVYDRRRHDPVAEGIAVSPGTSIVLLEGNYLLDAHSPWGAVSQRLRPRLFLECDVAAARDRVVARHVRGGLSPDQAAAKYEANDRLNAIAAAATAANAHYVIRFEPQPAVFANPPRM
ncbi:MAG: hypothetical protein HY718_10295 [Planctomycetes bacterium]|nr:hypothetical protein [Planctomycetota bacterium]